eukprot:11256643-Karenia_brevis.AAC.1
MACKEKEDEEVRLQCPGGVIHGAAFSALKQMAAQMPAESNAHVLRALDDLGKFLVTQGKTPAGSEVGE